MNPVDWKSRVEELLTENRNKSVVFPTGKIVATTKLTVDCEEHGSYIVSASNLCKGCLCVKCGEDRRRKHHIKNWLSLIHKRFKTIGRYTEVLEKTKVTAICPLHGKFVNTALNLAKAKYPCSKCLSQNKKELTKTETEWKRIFQKQFGIHFSYKFKSPTTVEVTCDKHSEKVTGKCRYLRLLKFGGCKECRLEAKKGNVLSISTINLRLNKKGFNKIKTLDSNVSFLCESHGEQVISWKKALGPNNPCIHCGKENVLANSLLTGEQIQGKTDYKLSLVGDTKYKLSEKTIAVCEMHGEFEESLRNLLYSKCACPTCRDYEFNSSIEKKLYKHFSAWERESRIYTNNRYSADFYNNDLGVAFEVNGRYWHKGERYKHTHRLKFLDLADRGIALFQFWDSEIRKIKVIKSILESYTSTSKQIKSVKMKKATKEDFASFCAENWMYTPEGLDFYFLLNESQIVGMLCLKKEGYMYVEKLYHNITVALEKLNIPLLLDNRLQSSLRFNMYVKKITSSNLNKVGKLGQNKDITNYFMCYDAGFSLLCHKRSISLNE